MYSNCDLLLSSWQQRRSRVSKLLDDVGDGLLDDVGDSLKFLSSITDPDEIISVKAISSNTTSVLSKDVMLHSERDKENLIRDIEQIILMSFKMTQFSILICERIGGSPMASPLISALCPL